MPATSEKTKAVPEKVGIAPSTASESETAAGEEPKAQSPRPGHGRNGADEFMGANRVWLPIILIAIDLMEGKIALRKTATGVRP